jgi:mono/diheme cytochrome c family protein
MKTIARIAVALASVVAIAAIFLILKKPAQRAPLPGTFAATPERLARGEYLVRHVTDCLECHSEFDWDTYGMPHKKETEGQGGFPFTKDYGVPGVVQAQNITQDPETGLGNWTDGEILRAIREGVAKDGHALFPMMPYQGYAHMSDEDAMAIVVYLRTLKPVRHEVPPRQLAFPVNFIVKFIPQPLSGPVEAPDDAKDHLAYGHYMAGMAGCIECHTAHDEKGQPIPGTEFGGGWEMKYPGGRVITANITAHPDTWVGQATKQEFIGRFRCWLDTPRTKAAKGRNTIMGWESFAGMTDQDLGAIYDYLQTVKQIPGVRNPFPDAEPTAAVADR